MFEFLHRDLFGNSISDYLWVAGVIVFVLLLNRIISKYIAHLLCKIFRRSWKTFDEQRFTDLIIHPLGIFLVITVSIIGFYRLSFPGELNVTIYKYPLQSILLALATIVQIGAFTWLLLRIVDYIAAVLAARALLTQDQSDNQLIVFFRDFFKVLLGVLGVVLILKFAFSYNVSSLLTGLSIVGAAIALALRESLENLIASFVIFFDKPFTTGDFVKVQQIAGTVERIGLRSTRVRTADKSYVTVPNKQMVDSVLDNVSLRSQIRGEVNLLLELNTSPADIHTLCSTVKQYLSEVKEIQSFTVLFNEIRPQAFVVFIEFFTPNMQWSAFTLVKQDVNYAVLKMMKDLNIQLADVKA